MKRSGSFYKASADDSVLACPSKVNQAITLVWSTEYFLFPSQIAHQLQGMHSQQRFLTAAKLNVKNVSCIILL